MSNQQVDKQSFPNTNMDRLGHTVADLQLPSFTFFTAQTKGRSWNKLTVASTEAEGLKEMLLSDLSRTILV